MQIQNETEILDEKVRYEIIKEILSSENLARKHEAYRRFLCYKDRTNEFVIERLKKQFDADTVNEMEYCISNISFTRKIVDKLARVYNSGVERKIEGSRKSTKKLQGLENALEFNSQIRSANKFLKLQRNVAFYIKPCPVYIPQTGETKYTIKPEPLNPYLYDVIEDCYDRTKPICYILSDFNYSPMLYTQGDITSASRPMSTPTGGNGKDEKIADNPQDAMTGILVWWTDSYHFTTNYKGQIIDNPADPGNISNPIKELPFVNFATDQDGQFWAEGGGDLADGAILVNCMLTHNQHVGVTQGYGQFWMKGKNLPRSIKIGPTKSILMEYEKEDPTPELGYATASPQIDSLRVLTESYIALLLTTNNLSTSAVASSLGQSNTAASGVAMLIDKAESMEDVNDQRQIFIDKEPKIWKKIALWIAAYGEQLVDEIKEYAITPADADAFSMSFKDAPVIMSEGEKLANMKLRMELGLDSQIDLIMKDNPALTREQAQAKMKEMAADKIMSGMKEISDEQKIDSNGNQIPTNTNVQKTALNGAQVTAMVDVVSKVSLGLIPREAGIQILYQAFNIEESEALRIMGNAGNGFKVEVVNAGNENNGKQPKDNEPDKFQE